jgi:hypothetical protein
MSGNPRPNAVKISLVREADEAKNIQEEILSLRKLNLCKNGVPPVDPVKHLYLTFQDGQTTHGFIGRPCSPGERDILNTKGNIWESSLCEGFHMFKVDARGQEVTLTISHARSLTVLQEAWRFNALDAKRYTQGEVARFPVSNKLKTEKFQAELVCRDVPVPAAPIPAPALPAAPAAPIPAPALPAPPAAPEAAGDAQDPADDEDDQGGQGAAGAAEDDDDEEEDDSHKKRKHVRRLDTRQSSTSSSSSVEITGHSWDPAPKRRIRYALRTPSPSDEETFNDNPSKDMDWTPQNSKNKRHFGT